MALDRTNTSSRDAFIKEVVKALGLKIEDKNLSHATIYRKRVELRKEVADGSRQFTGILNCYQA